MWINDGILEEIAKYIFFSNSPNYIVNGLKRTHILDILKMTPKKKEDVISEINYYLPRISENIRYYAYVYTLVVFLETNFPSPYIDNFRYNNFIHLKQVLTNFRNQCKSSIITIETNPIKRPIIQVVNGV
jgi:hypothetical protein